MIISCYFDESGKFRDSEIVCFCGLVTPHEDRVIEDFNLEWGYWLRKNGLKELAMKTALNHRRPLSSRNKKKGLDERIDSLRPFVETIAKYFPLAIGMSVDVVGFTNLPSHARRILGDPHYTVFERAMNEICLRRIPDGHHGVIICDDEEKFAVECYKLLNRMKLARPEVRDKITSIAFANDLYHPGLQAADLLASLTRQYTRQKFKGIAFEYERLFEMLVVEQQFMNRMVFTGMYFQRDNLIELAEKIQAGRRGERAVNFLGPESR